MTLSYLNAELDTTKEHELFQLNDLGFNVEINYNATFYGFERVQKQTLNNVTEVHHLFESLLSTDRDIAFESGIHGEGFTRKISYIDSVIITLETEFKPSFSL